MKKQYEPPEAEKIQFQYAEQVVASSCAETMTALSTPNNPVCMGDPIWIK